MVAYDTALLGFGMGRLAKPPGVEVDLRATNGEPAGVRLKEALRAVEIGDTVSVVVGDAPTRAEVVDSLNSTGGALIASIPFDGYERLLVRRRR